MIASAVLTIVGFGVCGTNIALADVEFNQLVTPEVIFGDGNFNGGFTTDRQTGIEIGLRGIIPFAGILNSNGDGTYSYTLAETDHDNDAGTPNNWNFDWTVNTDFDESSGLKLDDLTYELGMDGDPGLGTDFLIFDPIDPSIFIQPDHEIGTNATGNGEGVIATSPADYLSLLANNNVLQQSWQYAFFPFLALDSYNPDIPGTYAVYLLARDSGGSVVARSDIQVLIEGAPPAGPKLACQGFEAPMDTDVSVKKPNRVLPLRMALVDSMGIPLTGDDITANPVVQVTFNSGTYTGTADLQELDTAGKGDDGNMFVFNGSNWAFNMKTKGLASGSYTITAVSGDLAEYVIDPTCQVNLTIQ